MTREIPNSSENDNRDIHPTPGIQDFNPSSPGGSTPPSLADNESTPPSDDIPEGIGKSAQDIIDWFW